jgi:hypothetical protein
VLGVVGDDSTAQILLIFLSGELNTENFDPPFLVVGQSARLK